MEAVDPLNIWRHGKNNLVGVTLFFALFCTGFAVNGNMGIYLNLSGIIIVLGGTFTAVFLAYRMERIQILLKVLASSFTRPAIPAETLVEILVDLSIKRRINGLLSLEKKRRR